MNYVLEPYTIVIDSREQHPYSFMGFRADARQGKKPLVIPVVTAGLKSGDYSLVGYENIIAIERKSKSDCFSTFSHEHDRFERELARLNAMPGFAQVVVEASLINCITDPPPHTKYTGKSFYRQYIAWEQRFRGVHWFFAPTRVEAERKVLRTLQRYYRDDQERLKQLAKESA